MTKSVSFSTVIVSSAIVVMGLSITYFLPNSAFSQLSHSAKYSNSTNYTNQGDNSGMIWPNRNMTATAMNEKIQDNGIYNKSISTKNATSSHKTNSSNGKLDMFGILEIYPTKVNGREWYLDMNNPINDSMFSIGSNQNIIKQNDSSWRITNPEVRMNVTTPTNYKQWKNVEITGYVKVISIKDIHKDIPNDIAWLARGGPHNENARCNGTALIGGIHLDGTVGWKKEIWFTGGYTDELSKAKATGSILDRWIGWKVVMYNINNNTAVSIKDLEVIISTSETLSFIETLVQQTCLVSRLPRHHAEQPGCRL